MPLTGVLGEADCERALADLLLEQILLVQEQDYRRVREPFVVADRVEQLQRLLHSILLQRKRGFKDYKSCFYAKLIINYCLLFQLPHKSHKSILPSSAQKHRLMKQPAPII